MSQDWQARLQVLQAKHPKIGAFGAGILAALQLDLARDSCSLDRQFDIAHALVLRECALLDEAELIRIVSRNARTQKLILKPRDI